MDKWQNVRSLPFTAIAPILGINLQRFKRRGKNWQGYCPIHDSKNNDTCFGYADDGMYSCFSCAAKGKGAIDLVRAVRNIGFQDAVTLLSGIEAPAPVQIQPQEAPTGENKPFKGSYDKFFKPHPWLQARIPDQAILDRFGVGYYENNTRKSIYNGSVMLKIRRYSDGECVGYLSRNIGEITKEKPKYSFPKGFQKHLELFGAWELKSGQASLPLRVVYLVESPWTVMKFASLGLPAVSPFGWSVSEEQSNLLGKLAKGIVYLCDRNKYRDCAGILHILTRHLWVKAPELPEGCDDPEFLEKSQILALP